MSGAEAAIVATVVGGGIAVLSSLLTDRRAASREEQARAAAAAERNRNVYAAFMEAAQVMTESVVTGGSWGGYVGARAGLDRARSHLNLIASIEVIEEVKVYVDL